MTSWGLSNDLASHYAPMYHNFLVRRRLYVDLEPGPRWIGLRERSTGNHGLGSTKQRKLPADFSKKPILGMFGSLPPQRKREPWQLFGPSCNARAATWWCDVEVPPYGGGLGPLRSLTFAKVLCSPWSEGLAGAWDEWESCFRSGRICAEDWPYKSWLRPSWG